VFGEGGIVVVGAGAAGLVAAIFARTGGAGKKNVLLLERTTDGGRKILISGGGRCNVLPSTLQPERFVTDSPPHLLRGMLRSWPLSAQRAFFEEDLGIPLALEEETGKLFPVSNRARDVRDGLMALARERGVEVQSQTAVTGLEAIGSSEVQGVSPRQSRWRLTTSRGDVEASSVILATGGLSVPLTGSDGTGLTIARRLGHEIHQTYPALTPLTGTTPLLASLSGISLDVRIRAKAAGRTTESQGGFLFTHRGFSGPAVLDVSHVAVRSKLRRESFSSKKIPDVITDLSDAVIRIQWTDRDADTWTRELSTTTGLIVNLVSRYVPERLAEVLCLEAGLPPDRRGPELRRHERTALVDALTSYVLPWTGDEGYKKAEVTGGGVALTEVNARTLESVRHPGLFLCGEMLDAFGPIGGHNFAWAWATGRSAGLGAASQ
jgi:predicted Rossmann fold flavoprotein